MVNTNTQPLYEIKTSLVEFRDELVSASARFDSYFQTIDQQIGQGISRLTQDVELNDRNPNSSGERNKKIEQLNEAKRLMRQYQECRERIMSIFHSSSDPGAASNDSVVAISRCINALEEYLQDDMQVEGPTLSLRR